MGTVERVGTFARGAFRSRSSRRRQAVARIVVIGFLVFTIAMMVLGLVQSIRA